MLGIERGLAFAIDLCRSAGSSPVTTADESFTRSMRSSTCRICLIKGLGTLVETSGLEGHWWGDECSQSASSVRMPVTSANGWSSMTACPASGISITGATRPKPSYMI